MKDKGLRFIILLLLTIGWIILMRRMTGPLDPGLIIDFEFIGTGLAAANFISGLQGSGQLELMTRSIFLDFVFPLLYGASLYYGIAWICSKLPPGHVFNRFRLLSSLVVIAVIADFAENLCLLMLIYYTPNDLYAGLAYLFASVKFFLLGLTAAHFIISALIAAREHVSPREEQTSSE